MQSTALQETLSANIVAFHPSTRSVVRRLIGETCQYHTFAAAIRSQDDITDEAERIVASADHATLNHMARRHEQLVQQFYQR